MLQRSSVVEALERRQMLNAAPIAVDDAYSTTVNTTLRVTDPVAVAPGNAFPGIALKQTLALGYGVSQIEYSAPYDLVIARQGTSRIHVLDAKTGNELAVFSAVNSFTGFDLTADGRYLYVADYGGTNIGYGTPYQPSHVGRYDLANQTWQTKTVSEVAYQVEAVDSDRFLLKGIDQWVNITLDSFGLANTTAAANLATINANYSGDFEFDPASGRIYQGNSGISSPEIHVFGLAGNTLQHKEQTATYGSAEIGGGSSVLSTDGKYFFYGALQVDAFSVSTNIRKLPETIDAAGAGIAFGATGYYSQQTGAKLGSLPYSTTVFGMSDSSNEIWAFDSSTLSLKEYSIPDYGLGLLANDAHGDGDPLTAAVVSGPSHGTATVQPSGALVYVPNPGFGGVDTFTYTASDGHATSNPAVVSITVDQLPGGKPDFYSTDENNALSVAAAQGVLANDTDADSPNLTARLVTSAQHGVLSLNADGSFAYVPARNYFGSDVFTYVANDGIADSSPATVTLTVTHVNQPPTAQSDGYLATEDQALTVSVGQGVLANDTDVDSQSLSAVLVTNVQHGQLALSANGSFSYTPDQDFTGVDTFAYQASDGAALSNSVVVSLYTYAANQRPGAANDSYSLSAGRTLNVGGPTVSAASFNGLKQIGSVGTSNTPTQIEYSPAYNLLFLREGTSRVHVVDARSQSEISVESAKNVLTDMDVSPDGRYLYVADYGGTNIGYGTPSQTSYVHRYDAATRTWQTKSVTDIAYQVEAVDDDRFLLKSIDQWVSISLDSFGPPTAASAASLATTGADYEGDFEYDAASGRIYHGNSGISSPEIHVFQLTGNTLAAKEQTATYGSAGIGGGSSVLSTDGKYFFYGPLLVNAFSVSTNIRSLPEPIYAASGGIAFGTGSYYSSSTGELLGHLPGSSHVYAATDDGASIWAYDSQDGTLRQYSLQDVTDGVLANDTDPEHDAMTAVLVDGPAHGALTLALNGSFTYTPETGYVGLDSFTYTANDAGGPSAAATVTIQNGHPPVNTIPSAPSTVKNAPLSFSADGETGFAVTDVDQASQLDVLLTADHGTLTVSSDFDALTVDGNVSGQLHIQGSFASVNAALNTLILIPENDYVGNVALQITSNDLAGAIGKTDTDSVIVNVFEAALHNVEMATDVNGDGLVTPIDGLVIINDLIAHGSHPIAATFAAQALATESTFYYLDVHADNMISPLDALLVINRLTRPSAIPGPAIVASNLLATQSELQAVAESLTLTSPSIATSSGMPLAMASVLARDSSASPGPPVVAAANAVAGTNDPWSEERSDDFDTDRSANDELDLALAEILGS